MSSEKLINSFATNPNTDQADTTLNNGGTLASGDLTLTVNTLPAGVSAAQFRIKIDDELLLVTAIGGTGNKTWTVTRGAESTSAASHVDGSNVYLVETAGGFLQWLNDVGLAWTKLTGNNWKAAYTNGSGVVTELALDTVGRGLIAQGTAAAPIFAGTAVLLNTSSPTGTNVDFTSIPAGYKDLCIVWQAKSSNAASQVFSLQFNADGASNYDYVRNFMTKGTAFGSGTDGIAASSAECGIATKTGLTSYPCSGLIWIPNYSGTTFFKSYHSDAAYIEAQSTSNVFRHFAAGWWRSTAAINEVKITAAASNFVSGSYFELWGLAP